MTLLPCALCKGENDRPGQRHCYQCHREYQAEWRAKKTAERSPIVAAVQRDKRIKNKYDLSPVETEAMLRIQGNACAICVTTFGDDPGSVMKVDHDHNSGQVRGLLCNKCNMALGLFDDQPVFLDRAAQYLRATSSIKIIPAKRPKKTMADILAGMGGATP